MILVAGFAALAYAKSTVSAWWTLFPGIAFVGLGVPMRRREADIARLRNQIRFYERGLARLDDRWSGTGSSGLEFLSGRHLYAADLEIVGPGSLFELLCVARTAFGQRTLAEWLLRPSGASEATERQRAVAELAPRLDTREALFASSGESVSSDGQEILAEWANQPAHTASRAKRVAARVLGALGALAVLALVAHLGAQFGLIDLTESTLTRLRVYFLATAVLQAWILYRARHRVSEIVGHAKLAATSLNAVSGLLRDIEEMPVESSRLLTLQTALRAEGTSPAAEIAGLMRLMDLVGSRRQGMVRLVGAMLLWDVQLLFALEDWRDRWGRRLQEWFATVGEVEAIASLAAFCYENPTYEFPEFVSGPAVLVGTQLGHPLLPKERVVSNDIELVPDCRAIVVSGSNMSGKSTFLRTLGINVVLAQAGAPVFAYQMRLTDLRVGTSIQVQDSLRRGESRFFAEIRRLRAILDEADSKVPVLFLIDELLHGTNSHDRKEGAERILHKFVDRGAIGLVTTHDLALTELGDVAGGAIANAHFRDQHQDGLLSFDYRLRPGVVRKTNAMELMRSIGL